MTGFIVQLVESIAPVSRRSRVESRCRGGAAEGEGQGVLKAPPPTFRSRKYRERDRKLVWQNIPVSEILFSRTLWTAPSRFQPTFGRAAKVLLWKWYRLWPAWTPALPRAWRSENYASRSTSGYKYKNHSGSFQQNSCHRNASRTVGEVHKLLRTSCISYLYLWHRRLPSASFLPCASWKPTLEAPWIRIV